MPSWLIWYQSHVSDVIYPLPCILILNYFMLDTASLCHSLINGKKNMCIYLLSTTWHNTAWPWIPVPFIRNPVKAPPITYKEQHRNQKAAETITEKHKVKVCCVNSPCNAQDLMGLQWYTSECHLTQLSNPKDLLIQFSFFLHGSRNTWSN